MGPGLPTAVRIPPATKPAAKLIKVEDNDCVSEFVVVPWAQLVDEEMLLVLLLLALLLVVLVRDELLFVLLVPLGAVPLAGEELLLGIISAR